MNAKRNYQPAPVQTNHLYAFLNRIHDSGKGMPTHIIVGADGMPIYGQSIPFPLITGGTLLSDPYSDRDLRVVAFEDIDSSQQAIKEAVMETPPVIVRVVVRGSNEDKIFLGESE